MPHVGSGKKNEVAVLVLSFVSQMVMPKVFQCDLEAVKRLVAGLEADPTSVTSQELVQAIIDERCDGGKNFQKELGGPSQTTLTRFWLILTTYSETYI